MHVIDTAALDGDSETQLRTGIDIAARMGGGRVIIDQHEVSRRIEYPGKIDGRPTPVVIEGRDCKSAIRATDELDGSAIFNGSADSSPMGFANLHFDLGKHCQNAIYDRGEGLSVEEVSFTAVNSERDLFQATSPIGITLNRSSHFSICKTTYRDVARAVNMVNGCSDFVIDEFTISRWGMYGIRGDARGQNSKNGQVSRGVIRDALAGGNVTRSALWFGADFQNDIFNEDWEIWGNEIYGSGEPYRHNTAAEPDRVSKSGQALADIITLHGGLRSVIRDNKGWGLGESGALVTNNSHHCSIHDNVFEGADLMAIAIGAIPGDPTKRSADNTAYGNVMNNCGRDLAGDHSGFDNNGAGAFMYLANADRTRIYGNFGTAEPCKYTGVHGVVNKGVVAVDCAELDNNPDQNIFTVEGQVLPFFDAPAREPGPNVTNPYPANTFI